MASRGNASSTHLISCRQTMSGAQSFSQTTRWSSRWRTELTFQVAMRMKFGNSLDREAGAAAAGSGGVRVDHPERRADQIIDEVDFRAGQERHRGRIDQHHRGIPFDHQIILGLRALDVEFVLKARAAAALD